MTMTGDELRDLRSRKGWTQSQLATHLKVTPQYVGMMERDEKEIQPHVEAAIREVLGNDTSPDKFVPDSRRYREAKKAVLASLKKEPSLNLNGFSYHDFDNDLFESVKSDHESRARLFAEDSLAQVATALAWIDTIKITKTPNIGSYGAKHSAECWGRENSYAPYVANGALLVAAVYRNVPMKRTANSPNAELGLDPNPMPDARPGSFTAWLRDQVEQSGPLQDLARDAAQDRTFPVNTSSGPRLRSYLRSSGACEGALDALEKALNIWRAQRP